MSSNPIQSDRAAGCIVGAFIGDPLGLGPHWYYDPDELRRDFGPWIDGYTAPRPGAKYHAGMKAGESSQTGIIMRILLSSVAGQGAYDEADFTHRPSRPMNTTDQGNDRPGGSSHPRTVRTVGKGLSAAADAACTQ